MNVLHIYLVKKFLFRFYSENVKVFNGNWEIYYYREWTHMVSFVGDKTIVAISCPAISAWVKLIRGKKKFEFVYRCMHLGKWIFTRKKNLLIAGQIFSIRPSDSINLRDKFLRFYGQFAKSNSTALLSTNKVYKNTDQQYDIENWRQCELSNFRLTWG